MKIKLAMASLLSFAAALIVPCQAADLQGLLKNAPQSSTVIVAADLGRIVNLPAVKEMRKEDPKFDKEFQELELKLGAQGLTIDQFASGLVVFANEGGDFSGLLISTKLGDAKLESLLKGEIFGSPSSSYSVETVSGRKTYILKGAKPPILSEANAIPGLEAKIDNASGKTIALCFLDPETLLAIDRNDLEKYFAAQKGVAERLSARKGSIDAEAPLWGVIDIPKKQDAQQGNLSPMAMMDKVVGAAFSLNLKGQTQEDLYIKLCLECQDKAAAAFTTTQIQQLLFMLTMASSQKNPQLSGQLMNAIALSNADKNVLIDINLPKKLLESIKDSLKPQQPQPQAASNLTPIQQGN